MGAWLVRARRPQSQGCTSVVQLGHYVGLAGGDGADDEGIDSLLCLDEPVVDEELLGLANGVRSCNLVVILKCRNGGKLLAAEADDVGFGSDPWIEAKNERTKYLTAMRKADRGEYGPLGELIARAVTNNLYRFVVPAVAGPARLVPLASLVDPKKGITATALRAAAERGRLRAQKADNGTWLSSRNWVAEYQRNKHKRTKSSTGT